MFKKARIRLFLAVPLLLGVALSTRGEAIQGTWHLTGAFTDSFTEGTTELANISGTVGIGTSQLQFSTDALGSWQQSVDFGTNHGTHSHFEWYPDEGEAVESLRITVREIDDDTLLLTYGVARYDTDEAFGSRTSLDGFFGLGAVLTREPLPDSEGMPWAGEYAGKSVDTYETNAQEGLTSESYDVGFEVIANGGFSLHAAGGNVGQLSVAGDFLVRSTLDRQNYVHRQSEYQRTWNVEYRSGWRLLRLGDGRIVAFDQEVRIVEVEALKEEMEVYDGLQHLEGGVLTVHLLVPDSIGEVTLLAGEDAFVFRNGETLALSDGAPVFKGDIVETGSSTALRIDLVDGSMANLGADSRMEIAEFDAGAARSLINLTRGWLRTQTGEIDDVEVRTRNVGIGVRGTDFTVEYTESGGTGTTTVTVESGSVDVTDFSTGETVTVEAGQSTTVEDPTDAFLHALADAGLTGEDAEPGATPFGDGVGNLLKYAFNLDLAGADSRRLEPGAGGTAGMPAIELGDTGGDPILVIEFVRRRNGDLVYIPQTTTDLADWEPVTATETIESIDDDWERVTVDQPVDEADVARMFGRVEVELP